MEASLRLLRILQAAMLISIVLYAVVGEIAGPHHSRPMNLAFVLILAMVSSSTVLVAFLLRRVMVFRAAGALAQQPADAAALSRWRSGYIVTFALCESIALYGLVLRMLGQTLGQIAPFYLAGFLLMLYYGPRRPASDPMRDNMSAAR
jgi:F0F1-type ATP synthase membrane subunit c/vacuolar-type H+-ATPase subunit K